MPPAIVIDTRHTDRLTVSLANFRGSLDDNNHFDLTIVRRVYSTDHDGSD